MLGKVFERSLQINADRPAIRSESRAQYTYRDLDRWSGAWAGALRRNGVRMGDVVAIYTGNIAQFVVADIAVARIGAVKLPVNEALPAETISYMLKLSGAVAFVTSPALGETAQKILAGMQGTLPRRFVMSPSSDDAEVLPTLHESIEAAPETNFETPLAGDPAALYFTGGTTGRPKGVLHTQASTVALHEAQMLEAEIRQQDRLLLMTPLAHAAGLFAQTAILRGATIVLKSGFDAVQCPDWMSSESVSWTFMVPTMIYRLIDEMKRRKTTHLEGLDTIVYGAAPMSPARIQEAIDTFGRIFVQLYGQTECPNWGTRLVKSDHDADRPHLLSSCGQPSIHTDVCVINEQGTEVPRGDIGEVCLSGPYVLKEYLGNPEATKEKFTGRWIRTGDIGLMDEAGYVYLKDRKADMVISGGMNVYCRDVEDVLIRHPSVKAVAVIGIPHQDWGEAVHAVIVPNERFDEDELKLWSRDLLASYARPKSIAVVESLPETPFGKVDKRAIRNLYWEGSERGIN